MQTFKVDFRRFWLNLLAPSVSALAISLMGLSAWAAGPAFVGLTGVETRSAENSGAEVIEFKADLPFHYQMQILDKNRVVFRLYNVQMASNLLSAGGTVNLLSTGTVQSAVVRSGNKRPLTEEAYQEIVFQGPGLGDQKIQVVGATELPVMAAKKPSVQSQVQTVSSKLEALGKRPIPPLQHVKFSTRGASISFPNLSVLEKNVATKATVKPDSSDNKQATALLAVSGEESNKPEAIVKPPDGFQQRIDIEAQQGFRGHLPSVAEAKVQRNASEMLQSGNMQTEQARPEFAAKGPQIESVTRIPTRGYLPVETHREAPEPKLIAEPRASQALQEEQTVVEQSAEVSSPSEPAYQMLMPLPRYQGGAPPIQAVTLDESGKPVMLRSKSEPIQELSIEKTKNGGYNALFQADTQELTQGRPTVDRLMTESLSLYHDKQFPKAEKLIGEALQLDPANADLYAALAEVQLQLGQTDPAIQSYKRASDLAPKQYGQLYAQVLVQNGKRQEAIKVLTNINQQHPQQVQLVYMLGTLHEELGQVSEALTYLKQAAQLHPASVDIQYNLGLAYELAGDHEQAEKHYRQALDLNPSASDAAKALERVRN